MMPNSEDDEKRGRERGKSESRRKKDNLKGEWSR